MILDASAVLAFLFRETGQDRVTEALLADPRMSTINLAEVVAKYVQRGAIAEAGRLRDELPVTFVPVDEDLAVQAALMLTATKRHGLSLAGRICLALGRRMGLPVLTADRAWLEVAGPLGVTVEVIR